jgi:hypothetical protein
MSKPNASALDRDQDFARVVAMHRGAILRYGLRRLDDQFAAEDLVVEAFIVVWRRFDELPSRDEEPLTHGPSADCLLVRLIPNGAHLSLPAVPRVSLEHASVGLLGNAAA